MDHLSPILPNEIIGVILSFTPPRYRSIYRTVNKYISQQLKPSRLPGKNRISNKDMILLVEFIKKERIDSFVSYVNNEWNNYLNSLNLASHGRPNLMIKDLIDSQRNCVVHIEKPYPYPKNRFAFKSWFWLKRYNWNKKLGYVEFSVSYRRRWFPENLLKTNGHFEFSLIHKAYGYLSTSKFLITRTKEFSWEHITFDEVSGIKCIKY